MEKKQEKDRIERFLKEFNIKPCKVKVTNMNFSKIGISCSATSSEPNVQLSCDLKQKNANTFSLKITRTMRNDAGAEVIGVPNSSNSQ